MRTTQPKDSKISPYLHPPYEITHKNYVEKQQDQRWKNTILIIR